MIKIPLTKGEVVTVDDCDGDLAEFKWHYQSGGYAARRSHANECPKWKIVLMHRAILERKLDRRLRLGEQVDHVNRDGLDNRRCNIRLATDQQNKRNRGKIPGGLSRYIGVTRSRNRWLAQMTVDYKHLHLGAFDSEKTAARTRDMGTAEHFGRFAVFNFPDEWEWLEKEKRWLNIQS
jgi:hypothetical protein